MNNNKWCAFNKDGKCTALTDGICFMPCGFYKTHYQEEKSLKATQERLMGLPREIQKKIARKYYEGQIPWWV